MASKVIEAAEAEFREALADAARSLKGTGANAAQAIIDEYAPRFARLAAMDPADARLEYDDLMVNMEIDGNIAAIEAQTAGAAGFMSALRVAARLARSLVFPSLGVSGS